MSVSELVNSEAHRRLASSIADRLVERLKVTRLPLLKYPSREWDRVHFAILLLVDKTPDRLEDYVQMAADDWRNVLLAAGMAGSDWPTVLSLHDYKVP